MNAIVSHNDLVSAFKRAHQVILTAREEGANVPFYEHAPMPQLIVDVVKSIRLGRIQSLVKSIGKEEFATGLADICFTISEFYHVSPLARQMADGLGVPGNVKRFAFQQFGNEELSFDKDSWQKFFLDCTHPIGVSVDMVFLNREGDELGRVSFEKSLQNIGVDNETLLEGA